MGRKKRGRPTSEREKELLPELLNVLPPDGSRVRFNELLRKTRLSPNTLSSKLTELQLLEFVVREVDLSEKPPKVTYRRLNKPKFFVRVQPPYTDRQLQLLKDRGIDLDGFIYGTTFEEVGLMMHHIVMAISEAFTPFPQLGARSNSKTRRPAAWIADKIIDIYIRPRMQALINFLTMTDPRTKMPIHRNHEVWRAIQALENMIGNAIHQEADSLILPAQGIIAKSDSA